MLRAWVIGVTMPQRWFVQRHRWQLGKLLNGLAFAWSEVHADLCFEFGKEKAEFRRSASTLLVKKICTVDRPPREPRVLSYCVM